jgi:hypothetical protein
MPKRLSQEQVEQFEREGYTYPIDVLTIDEVARCRAKLEQFENGQGAPLHGPQKSNSHLLFDWVHEMVTHTNMLDAVEDLIGPNIMLFYSNAWLKEPGGPGFVSWHQDATYFGLAPAEQVTAWLALSASTPESGCVSVLPGTHKAGQITHHNEPVDANLLTSGQTVDEAIDQSQAVDMVLEPGQMSVHHTHVLHGSNPNVSTDRRLGFCFFFIPTHLHQLGKEHCTALLVRGVDEYGNFGSEAPPHGNADPVSAAAHAEALRLYRAHAEEAGHPSGDRHD